MKRVVLIYVLLSFVFLVLFAFTGYNIYYLILNISHNIYNIYYMNIIFRSVNSLFGCLAIIADVTAMVLLKKAPASKLAMDSAKEKRIKKMEAKIESLKAEDKSEK